MEKIGEFGKTNTVSPDIARQRRKGTAFAGVCLAWILEGREYCVKSRKSEGAWAPM